MVVVTSEGLVRVDHREGRSASGDCEGDSNKYEDFSHGRILSKKVPRTIPHTRQGLSSIASRPNTYGGRLEQCCACSISSIVGVEPECTSRASEGSCSAATRA